MLMRMAQITGAHPRRALLATLLFVVVAGILGGPVAGSLKSAESFAPTGADSQVAVRELERASGVQPDTGVVLLLDSADRRAVASAARRLSAIPGVVSVTAPAATSRDGRRALVTGTIAAGADSDVADAVTRRFAGDDGVAVGGQAVANRQITETISQDLARAELLAFPLLLILSLVFFRRRAALLPAVVGVTTVLGTFLALTAINQAYNLSVFALNLVIGLGLGLAIDYTLLLVTRYREELERGPADGAAIARTVRGAGRTIAFSGVTVAAALVTLTVFPQNFLKSMGIAGATVALVASAASMLVTPPLLALWGAKLARPGGETREDGRWYRLAQAVMRRPGRIAAATTVVMLVAAVPALTVRWTPVDASTIPQDQSARVVADALTRDFGDAGQTPVVIAVTARPGQDAEVARYAAQVRGIAGLRSVAPPRRLDAVTWRIDAAAVGDPAGPAARDAVVAIRALEPPFAARVGGGAATFLDAQHAIGAHLPLAMLLIVGLTFLVLWRMTGSVVLPVKAIVMNGLTVAAALAPLVLIYQHDRLTGVLGYTGNGGVEPSDFLVTATLVFALSTDYGVVLLSRIKELRDSGMDDREAVAAGVGRTGRVITAAAILLAVAIGAFSTSSISFIQQIGIASATGVLIDAFVVRSLLVPSLMALLGRWNWWSPRRWRTPSMRDDRAAA